MKVFNRYIFLFFVLVALLLGVAWKFIQSEGFAKVLISEVDKKISADLNAEIDFDNVELQIFPPKTILKNVSIKQVKEGEAFSLEVNANSISFNFGFESLFRNKLVMNSISITDGRVRLVDKKIDLSRILNNFLKSENKKSDFKISDIFSFYKENIFNRIAGRIKNIEFNNVDLHMNSDRAYVEKLKFFLDESKVNIASKLMGVKLSLSGEDYTRYIPDSLEVSVDLFKNIIVLNRFDLLKDVNLVQLRGRVFEQGQTKLSLVGDYSGEINSITSLFKVKEVKGFRGEAQVKLGVGGDLENIKLNYYVKVNDLVTDYLLAEGLELSGSVSEDKVFLNNLQISTTLGNATISDQVEVFDLETKKSNPGQFKVNIDGVSTSEALYSIRDVISPLRGRLYGDVNIEFKENGVSFSLVDGFRLADFRLRFGNDDPILINEGYRFESSELFLNDNLDLNLFVKLKRGLEQIEAYGQIKDAGIDIKVFNAIQDMNNFGPISGVQILGLNKFNFKAYGPWENVILNFDGTISKFNILDFKIQKVSYDLDYVIADNKLKFNKMNGSLVDGGLSAEGEISFDEEKPLNLNFDIENASYAETPELLHSVFQLLPWYPQKTSFSYSTKFSLRGGFDVSDLIIAGSLGTSKIKLYDETLDELRCDFSFLKSELKLNNIIINKKAGYINGGFTFKDAENFSLNLGLNKMRLEYFDYYSFLNLGLESAVDLKLLLERKKGGLTSNLKALFLDSKVESENLGPSSVNLKMDDYLTSFKGEFLGKSFIVDSVVNFDSKEKKKKDSFFSMVGKTGEIRQLLGVLASHNINDDNLSGNIDFNARLDFNPFHLENANALFNLNELRFYRGELGFKEVNKGEVVKIIDGAVEKFKIDLRGLKDRFDLSAEGSFKKNFNLSGGYSIDGSSLETISDKIIQAGGRFIGRFNLIWNGEKFSYFLESRGEDLFAKIQDIPGTFENLRFTALLNERSLLLKEFRGEFGGGQFNVDGKMDIKLPFPSVDFDYKLTDANLSILKNSRINLSGKGKIQGDTIPYILNGRFNLGFGRIEDPIESLLAEKYKNKKFERYIPKGVYNETTRYLELDLDIFTEGEVRIINSLTDLGLTGSVKVKGQIEDPRFIGDLNLSPVVSKIKFRGHEFIIDTGYLEFDEVNKQNLANIKISATTNIDQYAVKMNVSGVGSEVQINLSSSPPLAQEDILSLLTLGYTSDINKQLTEDDRQSVTSVSVGSLLVERFKLGEALNSSFGLQLSVSPEFGSGEGSMLQGSQGSQTPTSQLKSATKIKVRKNINKNLGVSFSSTVGGSLDQKQEVNVDYDFNESFTLQGIYEVKEVEDNSSIDPTSVGVDLRWRKTTK